MPNGHRQRLCPGQCGGQPSGHLGKPVGKVSARPVPPLPQGALGSSSELLTLSFLTKPQHEMCYHVLESSLLHLKAIFDPSPENKRVMRPLIQSEVSQKEKHQYSILTHIYGI